MILLATDHLPILIDARAVAHEALLRRIDVAAPQIVGVPVIAAEEQYRGWLAVLARQRDVDKQVRAYDNLAKLFELLGEWDIIRFDAGAANAYKRLHTQFRRIGTQDPRV